MTALLIALGAASWVASAGAEDKRTYQAELFNGFGLVDGSELRIGGVTAGTITDLDITPEKTALITFDVGPEFPELKADASCSSEPQSLIAEYFLDCQPGSSDQPLKEPIEAANNQTTVQNDLVNNTLREPYKRRFQLILNEFGTALVGNGENLNAAIRAGAPALRELRKVLKILGRQNRIISQLNVDSDTVFARLTERREDVARFIDEAEDTARVSASRRADLSRNFDLLDDFLFELRPVMRELGNLAREQTPLLTDLNKAAPGLNTLATNLPAFNEGTRVSLKSLGNASVVGRRALSKADDEIAELRRSSEKAFPAADIVATFLESLDDPRYAVEEDARARTDLCPAGDPRTGCQGADSGEADRRVATLEQKLGADLVGGGTGNPGYTGLEGLLNYVYRQTISVNFYDQLGHGLHINAVGAQNESEGGGRCGQFAPGPSLPTTTGADTQNVSQSAQCVAALGDVQPGITPGTFDPSTGLALGLPPYHGSVCPDGSTRLSICNPASVRRAAASRTAPPAAPKPGDSTAPAAPTGPSGQGDGKPDRPGILDEIPGLIPDTGPVPNLPQIPGINLSRRDRSGGSFEGSARSFLNYLLGS
ncbi:hypothetical protein BH20ACT15_BH20ACT15_01730 [soil metagenome]